MLQQRKREKVFRIYIHYATEFVIRTTRQRKDFPVSRVLSCPTNSASSLGQQQPVSHGPDGPVHFMQSVCPTAFPMPTAA